MNAKTYRYVFWPLWFVVVPALLAILTVSLLTPSEDVVPTGAFERFQWLVKDQRVPALIVFFTIYEIVLYSYRYALPFAAYLGTGGRPDIPRELRRDFEHAAQLLEEADRIQRRKRSEVERALTADAREELSDALEDLRDTMAKTPFVESEFSEAFERATRLVSRHLAPWQKGELREYVESIGVAVLVALLLRALVVEAFKIPSGSMLPTLQIQDHIFVNKLAYGPALPFTNTRLFSDLPPKRGDVMVFEFPDPNPNAERQDFIKRVIALEGDVLKVENGHPIINDWRVPNCKVGTYDFKEGADSGLKRGELYVEYLGEYAYLTLFEEDRGEGIQGPYKVKPGEVWVLGDNRNNSSDSRAWNGGRGGGVPYQNIKGRAMFVWLSFSIDGSFTFDRLAVNVMGKPRLPKGAPDELVNGIERCLKERPPLDQTLPPAPKNTSSPAAGLR